MTNSNELTQEDLDLLKRLNKGEVSLDEINRKQVMQIFTKILCNPTSIKAREWLLSELLKISNSLNDICQNCGVKLLAKSPDSN